MTILVENVKDPETHTLHPQPLTKQKQNTVGTTGKQSLKSSQQAELETDTSSVRAHLNLKQCEPVTGQFICCLFTSINVSLSASWEHWPFPSLCLSKGERRRWLVFICIFLLTDWNRVCVCVQGEQVHVPIYVCVTNCKWEQTSHEFTVQSSLLSPQVI